MSYLEKFKLKGKKAVVCGGNGLIGRETCKALSDAGAEVLILDIANNTDFEFEKFDVTKIKSLSSNVQKIWKKHGPIHVWINAAYPRTKDWGKSDESFQENIDMQMNSVCLITMQVAELMKEHEVKGSIVNIGSIYGVVGPDFSMYIDKKVIAPPAAYAAIKGGLLNFSRHTAAKYGNFGIRVNCLNAGGVFDNQDKKFVEMYSGKVPLNRMANAEDIASSILFLASEASSYITGTSFMVDGGWTTI